MTVTTGNFIENTNKVVKEKKRSAIIIGGGLVGALSVCILAERGYDVVMYEKRDDIRKSQLKKGRSINLALSHRGRKALELIGLETEVLKNAIPMAGRFLHKISGKTASVPYDAKTKQCIYSVGRNALNERLLYAAENYKNVKLFFNHKLVGVDFRKGTIKLLDTEKNEYLSSDADFVIGADGAFSKLRTYMQNTPLFDLSQSYIEHGYLELEVPAIRGSLMKANHLHIWPRGEFMMIALPNKDNSWTVTLFMPFSKFNSIDTEKKVLGFFQSTFPDAVPLIGEAELKEIFFRNKPLPLVAIKCNHYHVDDKFLIIGDAAHAMVPFYGQGMNAGFEDCFILNKILNETNDNIKDAIKLFSMQRKDDAHAICDLAMYNYIEMRDLVTKPSYKLRHTIDNILFKAFPGLWIPLYNSVSFSGMRYSHCVQNRKWQDKVFSTFILVTLALLTMVIIFVFLVRH